MEKEKETTNYASENKTRGNWEETFFSLAYEFFLLFLTVSRLVTDYLMRIKRYQSWIKGGASLILCFCFWFLLADE